jgi:hypothetical protein
VVEDQISKDQQSSLLARLAAISQVLQPVIMITVRGHRPKDGPICGKKNVDINKTWWLLFETNSQAHSLLGNLHEFMWVWVKIRYPKIMDG